MSSPHETTYCRDFELASSLRIIVPLTLTLLMATSLLTPSVFGGRAGPLVSPDFSMSKDGNMQIPQSTPNQSTSGGDNVYLTSLNGFQGTISLSATSSPLGLSVLFSPPSVSLSAGGTVQSTVAVSSTVAGTFSLTVTATGSSVSHSIIITVVVTPAPPDILLSPSRVELRLQPGFTGDTTFAVTSLYGFSGTVSFYPSLVDPALTPYFNPSTVTLSANGTVTTTLFITVASNTQTDWHGLLVNAQAQGITRIYQSVVSVGVGPSFSMSTNPYRLTLLSGSNGTSTITLASQAEFDINATITVNVSWLGPNVITPIKPSVQLSSNPVLLKAGGTALSALSINTSGATLGDYDIILRGGGCVCLLPTTDVRLTIVSDPPGTINLNGGGSLNGLTVTAQGTFTLNTSTNALTGSASIIITDPRNGQTLFSKTYAISISLSGSVATFLLEALTLAPAALCQVNTATHSATCAFVLNPDVHHDGMVDIGDLALIGASFGSTSGDGRWNPSYDLNGDGVIDIVDFSIVASHFGLRGFI